MTQSEPSNQCHEAMAAFALAKVGCGYIYGATGWICTQARLDQQARQYPQYADTIRKNGPKWLGRVCYDCAQLTKAAAKAAGIFIPSGATSQWKADIWAEQGTIDTMPKDSRGVFLYRQSGSVMQHTGICLGDGTFVDARGHAYGVLHSKMGTYAWTHWARLRATGPAENLTGKDVVPANLKAGTSTVNLREKASDTAGVLRKVDQKEVMRCLNDSGEWAECAVAGLRGFVMRKYLRLKG